MKINEYFKVIYFFFFIIRKYTRIIISLILQKIIITHQLFNSKLTNQNSTNNKNYVFFLYGGIGDHIMLKKLIDNLSLNHKITIFLNYKFKFLDILFPNCEIEFYNKKKIFSLLKLRDNKYKNSVFLSSSSSIEILFIFLFSKCKYFMGVLGDHTKIFSYNKIIKTKKINRYELFNSYFFDILNIKNIIIEKKLTSKLLLKEYKIPENYIIININKTKKWGDVSLPILEWNNLLKLVLIKTKFNIVLVGSENEYSDSIKLIQNIPKEKIHNFTGKTNFAELCYVLQNAKKIITTDSGIMHLSGLFNKKIIAVFTFSDPNIYCTPNDTIVLFNKVIHCQPCVKNPSPGSDNYPPICFNKYKCNSGIDIKQIFDLI